MFKRLEKRRRKREEEDALGLDDELKQVLGMNDTDSEESSDDSSGDESGFGGSDGEGLGELSDGGEGNLDEDGAFDDDEEELEEESDEEDLQPQIINPKIRISQALLDPLYLDPQDPMIKLCLSTVRPMHAHGRRVKQFSKRVKDEGAAPEDDAFTFIQSSLPKARPALVQSAEDSGKSKRALKKEAQKAFQKAKREKAKERLRSKKAAAPAGEAAASTSVSKKAKKAKKTVGATEESPSKSPQRPSKKRRIVKDGEGPATAPSNDQKDEPSTTVPTIERAEPAELTATSVTAPLEVSATVKSIAKTASDRAKSARAKIGVKKAAPKRKLRG